MSAGHRFAGRCAIVTGGASGLGLAVARRIAAEGGQLCLWDIDPTALADARAELGAIRTVAVDVSDHVAVRRAAAGTFEGMGGRIDILVAAAGIAGAAAPVHDYPIDGWLRVIDVNLNGLFYCNRAIVPYMLRGGYGRIVNVASTAGNAGAHDAAAYAASQAGVVGFTRSLARELGDGPLTAHAFLDDPADMLADRVAKVCGLASATCGAATPPP